MGTEVNVELLQERAWAARKRAYAPYSQFLVGAALLTRSGEIFTGCNVENVSFGLTLCAERAAVAAAIQAGHRDFVGIAVAADTAVPVIPCGACRQFLAEFSTDLAIYCICRNGLQNTWSLSQLLP